MEIEADIGALTVTPEAGSKQTSLIATALTDGISHRRRSTQRPFQTIPIHSNTKDQLRFAFKEFELVFIVLHLRKDSLLQRNVRKHIR